MRSSLFTPGTRTVGALIALYCVAAMTVAGASQAAPAITITDYKIISDLPAFPTVPTNGPSPLQAGATTEAGSYTTFGYSNSTEDVLTALTNFAPGLLGNPTATPRCAEADLQANTCPANTKIGTSRLDAGPAGTNTVAASFAGTVYNAAPLANEPGRLGVVTPTPFGALVSSIPFHITPRGTKDYGLTGILTDVSRLALGAPFGNLQVLGLSFLLNGSTNNYVRNPTSCGTNTSTGQAIGYDDPTAVDGPAYTFTTTGCDQEAFSPSMSLTVGDRGTTRQFGFPPLIIRISQPAGQADVRNNAFTLPIELNSNNSAYTLCTQAQVDGDSCPAGSKFGNATANSPFLHEPVSGPVYLVEQAGTALPGLLLDLNGRAHVKIQTSSKFVNGNQIQSITTDAPQLPITDLTLALNGGRTSGVFQTRNDLCFRNNSTSRFRDVMADYALTGWNGKATATTRVRGQVKGCGPAVAPALSGGTGTQPSLKVTLRAHPDSPAMKDVTLRLGNGLSASCRRLRAGAGGTASPSNPLSRSAFRCVNSRTLRVNLPSPGARNVSLRLRRGAVVLRSGVRKSLRRGTARRLLVRATPTPMSGTGTATSTTFRVKGKKRG